MIGTSSGPGPGRPTSGRRIVVDAGQIRVALHLEPRLESAMTARRAVHEALGRYLSLQLVEEAVLLTSEIVTNAIMHTGRGCELQLSFDPGLGILRVEVSDRSRLRPLQLDALDCNRLGGRGLQIVAAMATQWGTFPIDGGKIVWFELADGARSSAASADRRRATSDLD
ncbi:MAG TPA: ATP-binding protein [Ilumatobacter sp.]|nr:ATP-binding protein [Ilumatobacter sp.]